MNVENLFRNLRVLLRADRIVAEIQLRRMIFGVASGIFAALFAAFGVLMLELAAYFALIQYWTAIAAAILLGVVNFALGGLTLLVASRKARDRGEFETAVALHNSAVDALQAQARSFDATRPLTSGLESILPSLVVPAIGMLVKSLRQRKAEAGK
jgi:4-amino-4-deoxy-L-arabinose transferase-like glycosyltransferase